MLQKLGYAALWLALASSACGATREPAAEHALVQPSEHSPRRLTRRSAVANDTNSVRSPSAGAGVRVPDDLCRSSIRIKEPHFDVHFEHVEGGNTSSRFVRRAHARCGDFRLELDSDSRFHTLSVIEPSKTRSSVLWRASAVNANTPLVSGCVDLNGDGGPEIVVNSADPRPTATVFSLAQKPRRLFHVQDRTLGIREVETGSFRQQLLAQDFGPFTFPMLPEVYVYEGKGFLRLGKAHVAHWRLERDDAKRMLDCCTAERQACRRAAANRWFVSSLLLGDWDTERKSVTLDPELDAEFDVLRPELEAQLSAGARKAGPPPSTWLLGSRATALEVNGLKRLQALATKGPAAETELAVTSDEQERLNDVPGMKLFHVPVGAGTVVEKCGDYSIEQISKPDSQPSTQIRIRDGSGTLVGRVVPATDWTRALWCADLTRDGFPEIMIYESTGGAHCCHSVQVLSLGRRIERLLEFDAGNAGAPDPRDLDGKGAYELLGADDVLYGESPSPYAGVYFLPIVFVYENGKYLRRTRRFKAHLAREREALSAQYREHEPAGSTDPSGFIGLSLLIGDWQQARRKLLVLPEVSAWFDVEQSARRLARRVER